MEEESSLIGNQVTSKVLRSVHQASDGGSSEINTLEQVKKGRVTTGLALNLNKTLNHGKLLLRLGLGDTSATETLDGAESVLLASGTGEPPGRFGGEPENDHERDRENPLKTERNSPGPLVVELVGSESDSGDDDGTDGPGHLESSRASTTKGKRDNLGSVSRANGDEETPWDTLESLANGEEFKRVGLELLIRMRLKLDQTRPGHHLRKRTRKWSGPSEPEQPWWPFGNPIC